MNGGVTNYKCYMYDEVIFERLGGIDALIHGCPYRTEYLGERFEVVVMASCSINNAALI